MSAVELIEKVQPTIEERVQKLEGQMYDLLSSPRPVPENKEDIKTLSCDDCIEEASPVLTMSCVDCKNDGCYEHFRHKNQIDEKAYNEIIQTFAIKTNRKAKDIELHMLSKFIFDYFIIMEKKFDD